jgi:hypothetical protein
MADSAGNTELVCTRVNRDLEIDLLVKRDLATAAYLTPRAWADPGLALSRREEGQGFRARQVRTCTHTQQTTERKRASERETYTHQHVEWPCMR